MKPSRRTALALIATTLAVGLVAGVVWAVHAGLKALRGEILRGIPSRDLDWLTRIAAKVTKILATAVGFYAVLRFLQAFFNNPPPPAVQSLHLGSGVNPWIASAVALVGCLALVVVSRRLVSHLLSRHLLEPTRQILLSNVESHRVPMRALVLRYAGLCAGGVGAAAFLDAEASIKTGTPVLGPIPVNGIWRWPVLIAAVAVWAAGMVAILRSNPFITKYNHRALIDVRPVVLLLGALDSGSLQEEVSLSDEAPYIQSYLSQLVRLLWLIGPVVVPDMLGARRDGQGAAVVATTRSTHADVVRTLATSARLIVVVLGKGHGLTDDLCAAAHANPSGARLVILVPARRGDRYERTRQNLNDLSLPPIDPSKKQKHEHAIFRWAICGSKDQWVVRELASPGQQVKSLGVWLNRQLKGFSDALPARPRCVALRIALRAVRPFGLGFVILLFVVNAWQAIRG